VTFPRRRAVTRARQKSALDDRRCGGTSKFLRGVFEDLGATFSAPGLLTHTARALLGLECTVVERSIAQHGP